MGVNIMGYGTKTAANPSLAGSFASGQALVIPAGQYQLGTGPYSVLQWYDPIQTVWRPVTSSPQDSSLIISSDGYNYRIANLTGTVVGAVITNGGTASMVNGFYPANTSAAITATVSGTTTAFNVIVGGACSTTVTIAAGGTLYTKVPTLQITNPPTGGLAMTATCTLTNGAISAVTVVNQGAGYTTAPTIYVLPGQGDTTGSGAALTAALDTTNQGKITGLTLATSAAGLTAVPAITFSGTGVVGSPAATAIMCVTATAVTWATPNHSGNGNCGIIASAVTAGSSTTTNPLYTTGIFVPRFGFTAYSTTASPTTTTIMDGGLHQAAPGAILLANSDGTINAATTATVTFGGVTDYNYGVQI